MSGSSISRALRRDAGIIAQPRHRSGYHVSGGGSSYAGIISVSCSDIPESRADALRARNLREHLVELGWDIEPLRDERASILFVNRAPKAKEVKK